MTQAILPKLLEIQNLLLSSYMHDFLKKLGPEVNQKPKFLNPRKNPKTRPEHNQEKNRNLTRGMKN